MIKNFNNNVVLTSQSKEAVLLFKYDGANRYIVPTYDMSIGISSFYVNGVELNKVNSSNYKTKTSIALTSTRPAMFHICTTSSSDYGVNLRFDAYSDSSMASLAESIDVSVFNRPFIISHNDFNLYSNDKIIVDNESSYLVLRTNPKFSGNIKLIVDSSDNLYLDTFKVSDILSNKKYRRQQVSANSTFSSDVRKVFDSIPIGELYKVDKYDTLDITLPKTSIDKQFNTTYNYGATLFRDELYPEDYSILAPLWVNSILPDFFVLFRLDGTFNIESYDAVLGRNIDALGVKYLKESKLIKSWSINQKNNLGKYLHNHLNELKTIQSPVYLPLSDYDHNVWNGISVKKGIITSSQETSYQFEKAANNFTDVNAFVSTGFERNNVLCPNLINLEYAFNDESANMYSMHRYFGLYLSENVLYKIAYYKESDNDSFNIISLDGKDVSEFISKTDNSETSIFDLSGNIHDKFKNRIFAINDNNSLTRISSTAQINDIDYIDNFCNKADNNIFSTKTTKKNINQFISISLTNNMLPGDHLRVINKTQNTIWEIYGVEFSPIMNEGDSYTYCSKYNVNGTDAPGYPKLYRNAFSTIGEMTDQVDAIKTAFNMFNEFEVSTGFYAFKNNNDSFSIVINNDCDDIFSFQHITSQQEITTNEFTNESNPTYVNFFGQTNAETLYMPVTIDASFGPINFEFYGRRNNVIADFVIVPNNLYSILDDVIDKFQPYMYYKNTINWNKLVQSFDVSIGGNLFNYQYIKDPTSDQNKNVLNLEDVIGSTDGKLYGYAVHSVNISLMGINSVKDFDFNVYEDLKSEYFYKRDDDKSTLSKTLTSAHTFTDRNSYVITYGHGTISINNGSPVSYDSVSNNKFNTFFGSATLTPLSETIVSYNVLDGSQNFLGYKEGYKEEYQDSYYTDVNSKSKLKYGLTTPYVTKWVMQGTDCRNNEMRLVIDSSLSKVAFFPAAPSGITNFIPNIDISIFSNEISIPSFKYLSTNNIAAKDYIYYDINDVILDGSNNSLMTIKESMIARPYIDIASKLMHSNKNNEKNITRMSILTYNKYKNSVDTIFSGLKLSLSSNKEVIELPSIENYNRYKFGFISTPSRNYSNNYPIEVIINENTKTILVIWYQGNDILNYYYRNSAYNVGKSILSVNSDKSLTSFYYGNDASIRNFAKSPFHLKTDTLSISSRGFNPNITDFTVEESSPVVQLSLNNLNKRGNIFVSYADISINNKRFEPLQKTYNNFAGYFQYGYTENKNTAGNYVINQCNTYETSKNLYSLDTCNIKTLDTILKTNNIFYTIIRENKIYDNLSFGNKAFSLSTIPPKVYKDSILNHNGGFFPKFNNMLVFSDNEDNMLIDIVEKDFMAGNTNLSSYNKISQIWRNKVVYNISQKDVSTMNAITYDKDYNIFKSLWDAAYYTIDDGDKNPKINGYESPIELPTFFGSKLAKLPHSILLSKWDNLNSTSYFLNNDVILKFNLSLSISRIFKNEPLFISNWAGIPNASQFIDQYINNTILSYYSINLPSLDIKLYSKNTGSLSILNDYSISLNEISNQNYSSELVYEKGEYFYVINIKNTYNNLSYYTEITINQK